MKAIENSEDWNEISYHYYYDGQRCIEERNGSDLAIKQYVWGTQYVDELVQIRINPFVGANKCSYTFYPMHDANYNILGVASNGGRLIERYEYTPYGQRTVFSHAWLVGDCDGDGNVDANDLATINANYGTGTDAGSGDVNCDGDVDGDDQATWGANYGSTVASSDDPLVTHARLESYRINNIPYGLCDIGHQGLMHDKEFGLIHVRTRYLHTILGRLTQPDILRYIDGMNYYEYVGSNPINRLDPTGKAFYAVGGTWENAADMANPWQLYNETSEDPRYYRRGPGFFWGSRKWGIGRAASGSDCKGIAKAVKKQICKDFCKAKKKCKDFKINMTGWSRGATIVMGVAKDLNDDGCKCGGWGWFGGKRYKPVEVNWIGLFDAVEMIHDNIPGTPIPVEVLPGDNGWPDSVPSNVKAFSHAIKTAKQKMYPTTNFGRNEKSFKRHDGSDTDHGDIGNSKKRGNNNAYEWIKQQAINAGVKF